jgi:uncharacterized protein (TIGR02996 family)
VASRPAVLPTRPEVLAFLTDSKENPDDDAPRLVLADWLEERGDERGEFVRLQCQRAARGDARTPTQVGGREAALLEQYRGTWLGVLCEKGIQTEIRRGLVRAVGSPRKLLSKRLAALREYEPLAWVDHLSLYDVGAQDLPRLASSPHWTCLTQLDLEKHVYSADHLIDADTVGHSSGDWAALADLVVLPRLTELSFSCQDLGVGGATALAALPELKRLRSLDLACNNLGDRGAAALASSRSLTGLTDLNLTHNRIGADGFASLAGWPALATMTTLSLGQNYPGVAGVAALAASPFLGNLRELRLSADYLDAMPGTIGASRLGPQRFGPEGAAALAKARTLSWLARMFLGENRIGPEGAEALGASAAFPGLAELDLGGNGIGDAGAIALASSASLPNLTTLSLRYNGIGDRGAEALARSPYLSRLTSLNFRANRDTTQQGLALLKARFGPALDA